METNVKTKFHLEDVLSFILDRNLSQTRDGMRKLGFFMTNNEVSSFAVILMVPRIADSLKKQFPEFTTPAMKRMVAKLDKKLMGKNSNLERKKIVADWLVKLVAKYGKMITVKPLSRKTHQ